MSPLRRLRRLPARAAQSAPRGRGHGDTPTAAQHTRGLGLAARRSQCSSGTSLEAPQRTAGDRVHRAGQSTSPVAQCPPHAPHTALVSPNRPPGARRATRLPSPCEHAAPTQPRDVDSPLAHVQNDDAASPTQKADDRA
jgi:hypothetical protein